MEFEVREKDLIKILGEAHMIPPRSSRSIFHISFDAFGIFYAKLCEHFLKHPVPDPMKMGKLMEQQFEHQLETIYIGQSSTTVLDLMGSTGWECVGVVPPNGDRELCSYLFKRPVVMVQATFDDKVLGDGNG